MANNKEQKTKKENKTLTTFIIIFIVTFAFVALALKYFSPEIDVEIGKATEEEQADDNTEKGSVDERLRWIQFEDNMPGVSTRYTSNDEKNEKAETINEQKDEPIVYDDDTQQTQKDSETVNNPKNPKENVVKIEKKQVQTPEVAPITNAPTTTTNKTSKVYVGQFATVEQAISMQNKIMESSLGVSPFVKKVGGNYVLQIGSYSSAEKAHTVATEIQNAGFSARVVSE